MKLSRATLKRVEAELQRRYWTRSQLAAATRISNTTIHRMMKGESVHPHTIRDALVALGLEEARRGA